LNTTLEKELAALSLREKAEVIDFLLPSVVGDDTSEIEPGLMAELERRIEEDAANPEGSISLGEFHRKVAELS